MSWFNDKFFAEASGPLVTERIYKRFIPAEQGGGPPDTDTMRAARSNIRYHLSYIGWLVRKRDWLAGDSLTYADLSAAAHLSAVDYLGDVPWDEDETAKAWYARIKSRPSFRTLLARDAARSGAGAELRQSRLLTPAAALKSGARRSRPRARLRRDRHRAAGFDPARGRRACANSSPAAPTATWTGWRATPTGAAIRARCGAEVRAIVMLGVNYGPDRRSAGDPETSACAAPSRSMPRATTITR